MTEKLRGKPGLLLMRTWYDKLRLVIVYGSILFVILILYLGSFLGPARDFLLPAAIGVLTAFAVQTLVTIERQTGQVTADKEFPTVIDAIPALRTLVGSDKEITDVKAIAATGQTTFEVLGALVSESKAKKVQIQMQVIDNTSPLLEFYPPHWASEVEHVLNRIKTWNPGPPVTLSVNAYVYLPVVHGMLINDKHLLIGFFGWTSRERPELTGAQRSHHLYRRGDAGSNQFFEIFDEWFQHAPQREVLRIAGVSRSADGRGPS